MNKCKDIWGKIVSFISNTRDKVNRKLVYLSKKNRVMQFFFDYRKIFLAIVLFFLMMVILFSCTSRTKRNKLDPNDLEHIEFEFSKGFDASDNEALVDVISRYYAAYVDGDIATLETVATPISEDEKSFIVAMGQYYEEYQNVKVYAKDGIDKGSYFVSVYD